MTAAANSPSKRKTLSTKHSTNYRASTTDAHNFFIMDNLPKDPMMLFSFINMKLRDEYPSLDELCLSLDVEKDALCQKLAEAGFEYSQEHNKFW